MRFADLLKIVGNAPVFETGLLLAGAVDRADVQRQLGRWTASGRLWQLRRGLYALAPPYQKVVPDPFLVANRLVHPSYVSCEAALAYDGLIPEHVPVTVSVTTGRPGAWETPLGVYRFHHVSPRLFFGYARREVSAGQHAFVANPEKALLDLIYLTPGSDTHMYLEELRLQHLERPRPETLAAYARRMARPKLWRAVRHIEDLIAVEEREFAPL